MPRREVDDGANERSPGGGEAREGSGQAALKSLAERRLRSDDLEILQREVCYQGFYRLERLRLRHRLFSGAMSAPIVRETIEKSDVAAVLLYDPRRDEVVLIEQFRVGARDDPNGPWLLEVVAGLIEEGETPEQVARREAQEEAGCLIGDLLPMQTFYTSPAKTAQRTHLFLGEVDSSHAGGVHGLPGEGEDIRVVCVPAAQALQLVERGCLNSAWPLIALLWFAANRQHVRARWLA